MHAKHCLLRLSLPVSQTATNYMWIKMPHRQRKRASENRPGARLNKKTLERGNLEYVMTYYEHLQSHHEVQIAGVYWLKSEEIIQQCFESHRASKVCSQLRLDGFCSFRSCSTQQQRILRKYDVMMWRLGLGTQTCQSPVSRKYRQI